MRLLIIIPLLMMAGLLPAQDEPRQAVMPSYSLEEAQEYALENNYTILDKQYEIEKAQQTIRESLALNFPQIAASYDLTYNAIIRPVAFPQEQVELIFMGMDLPGAGDFRYAALGGGKWQPSGTLSAKWLIGDYSNFLAKRASEVLKETRRLGKEESEINVKADVAQAYYRVLVLQESVRLLEENLSSLQKNFSETRELYNSGFVEEQDVDQLELLVSNLENNLHNTERQEDLAMQMLKFQMGMPLENSINLTSSLKEQMAQTEESLSELNQRELNYEQHIQYKKINSEYRGSVLNYKNEKADLYPSLSFNASYTNFRVTNDLDPVNFNTYWAPAAAVTGSLNWDLFTGFARSAQIQEAKLDVRRTEVAKDLTKSQIKLEYDQARSDFLFALENYRTTERNVTISQKIRDKTRVKYTEGISSSLDLTQAENQYLQTQQDYVQSMLNLLQAKENLERALGRSGETQ